MNIIFLIIDSLRFDSLGVGGNMPSPSPFLDKLFSDNLYLTNAFSVGSPTEFSYPGLLTSTLPLDFGGYFNGISTRPISIAEVFQNLSYNTVRFADDYTLSTNQYDRGFNEIFHGYNITRFFADISDFLPYYKNIWDNEPLYRKYILKIIISYIDTIINDIMKYCNYIINFEKVPNFIHSFIIEGVDYVNIYNMALYEQNLFFKNKEVYAKKVIKNPQITFIGHLKKIIKNDFIHINNRKTYCENMKKNLLIRDLFYISKNIIKKNVHPRIIKTYINQLLKYNHYRTPSLKYLIASFFSWFDNKTESTPFFVWLHASDIHEGSFHTFDQIKTKSAIITEFQELRSLQNELVKRRSIIGNPIYNYSVKYSDMQVRYLINGLNKRKLLDNTLVVITSDHGHNSVEWPLRNHSNIAKDFYDELYHIPVAFIHNDVQKKKINGLYSSIDICPSILDFLNIPRPEGFNGISFINKNRSGRDYVLFENLGPGPGDKELKPIKICIRKYPYKLVYIVHPRMKSDKGKVIEMYNLKDDPTEQSNLITISLSNSKNFQSLLKIAINRVKDIRKMSNHIDLLG